MKVSRRLDHTPALFWARTVSAQLHAAGFLLLIVEAFVLLPAAWSVGVNHFWACLVYLVTGAFVFSFSSAYHFMHDGWQVSTKLETFLENLDHFGIYLFIAGTYTPVLLNTVSERWRGTLLVAIWSLGFLGIAYTVLKPHLWRPLRHRFVYTSIFLAMGWFLLIRAGEIFSGLSGLQLFLFTGGIVSYCLGAAVYASRWPNLFGRLFGYHELWHVSVIAGAQFHYFLILTFYR